MQTRGDIGLSVSSGLFGFSTSQIYESTEASDLAFWNSRLQYDAAIFFGPSIYHEMWLAVRLIGFGSRKTLMVLADGISSICSDSISLKYNSYISIALFCLITCSIFFKQKAIKTRKFKDS